MKPKSNLLRLSLLTASLFLISTSPVFSQAVWDGVGDWTNDSNWSGGTGPDGAPGAGQNITHSGGDLVVSTDVSSVGLYGAFGQQAGTFTILPSGQLDVGGNFRIAEGGGSEGFVDLQGELNVNGGLDVGYGIGDAAGGSVGTLSISGNASLDVLGTLDTWWDPGAELIISGGDAEIVIGEVFYFGNEATVTANINSDSFSTINVLGTATIVGGNGTLNVEFTDGYSPELGSSWRLIDAGTLNGTIPVVNLPDVGKGKLLSLEYKEGGEGQVLDLSYVPTLNLKVNSDGLATIENPTAGAPPMEIDGYIIRSESGALLPGGLAGMGDGWAPGLEPSQSGGLISETSLLGAATINQGEAMNLGSIFDTSKASDLLFEFHVAGMGTLTGTVEYVTGGGLTGDFNEDGAVDALDIDLLGDALRSGDTDSKFDLNGDDSVTAEDFDTMISSTIGTWIGDSNLDGSFDTSDLVSVFAAGQYEDGEANELNSTWATGDWNYDLEFDTADLVAAFSAGGFEQGPRQATAAVPEPNCVAIAWLALLGGVAMIRRT